MKALLLPKKIMRRLFVLIPLLVPMLCCNTKPRESVPTEKKSLDTFVVLETTMGSIKLKLYNETPLHKNNFIKLAEEGFYNGIIFHRVINNFMIQAGDPTTRQPVEGVVYGEADTGYTLPAEFVPSLFHKKGAIAAARMGDDVNPMKESSGSQFYIVQGKVFTPEQLTTLLYSKNEKLKNKIYNNLIVEKANRLMLEGKNIDYKQIAESLSDTLKSVLSSTKFYSLTSEQINVYTTIGGTPHLDGDYTVFGEVTEGFEVVDKIAAVQTNKSDRPILNVTIKRMRILTQ